MKADFEKLLEEGTLRSIGKSNLVVSMVKDQNSFDKLFKLLFHSNRAIVMRAADAVEKVSIDHPNYLSNHKSEIIHLGTIAKNKEFQWHLAQLFPRILLNENEFDKIWIILSDWVNDKSNSKIVRVNSMQSLYDLAMVRKKKIRALKLIISELEKECIASINARIKKFKFPDQ